MFELEPGRDDGEKPHIGWFKIGKLVLEKMGIGSPDNLRALSLGSNLYSHLYNPGERPRRIQLIDVAMVFPPVAEQALLSMLYSASNVDKIEAIELLARLEIDSQFAVMNLDKMTRDNDPTVVEAAKFWLSVRRST